MLQAGQANVAALPKQIFLPRRASRASLRSR